MLLYCSCYVLPDISSNFKTSIFYETVRAGRALEINTQTPSFICGKSNAQRERNMESWWDSPARSPEILEMSSVSAPAIFLSPLFEIITNVEGVKRIPALLFLLWPQWLHCGYTAECSHVPWSSDHLRKDRPLGATAMITAWRGGGPRHLLTVLFLCSSKLLSLETDSLVLRVLEFSPPVWHSNASCVAVLLQAPWAQPN